jgi:lipopolysaccharide export system protein LptC
VWLPKILPKVYIRCISNRKRRIELIILLAVFGTLIAWLGMRYELEQKAIDKMDREADAYFDSLQKEEA